MSAFTLDASGAVELFGWQPHWGRERYVAWRNLSPFEQGYVEAVFASLPRSEPTAEVVPTEMRAWVMDYMARQSHGGRSRNINTGTTYDDGADFCEAFEEAFPGRTPDPNLKNASKRLAKLLRAMWCDGQLQRGILGNEKYLPQEPSWQYVYSLYPRDVIRLRETLDHERCGCGGLSHIKEAACVHCGRTKAWAQPPGFSDLAPETLAAIRKDCAAFGQTWRMQEPEGARPGSGFARGEQGGRDFWMMRQRGALTDPPFPPLTPSLGDDGKVYLREGAAA